MASPFLGEIRSVSFDFPPKGWAFCDGQILPISQNTALFSLLGTMYGGDGVRTFALPNLQGRVAVGQGQGSGLSPYAPGDVGGEESHVLTIPEMALHKHGFSIVTSPATTANPHQGYYAAPATNPASPYLYGATFTNGAAVGAIANAGGGQPHENMQPYLTIVYIIALSGIFPSR